MAGIEVLLIAVLAVQLARLAWGMAAPFEGRVADAIPPAPTAAVAPLSGHAPFFPDASGGPSGAASLEGWRLAGVRRAIDPAHSAAILARDGQPQSAYRVGDVLAPGLVLRAVGSDHVLLDRGGMLQRLSLPEATAVSAATGTLPAAAAPAAPAPATSPGTPPGAARTVDPRELFSGAGLRAHREGDRVAGYTVMPGANDALLQRAGLRPGDVLLDVNGRALEPGRLLELADELRADPQARVTFRRDGQVHTVDLGAPAP